MHPIAHFKTITEHRHLVCRYCMRLGLIGQGLTHDLSKYSHAEFWRGEKYYQGYRSPNDQERRDKQSGRKSDRRIEDDPVAYRLSVGISALYQVRRILIHFLRKYTDNLLRLQRNSGFPQERVCHIRTPDFQL